MSEGGEMNKQYPCYHADGACRGEVALRDIPWPVDETLPLCDEHYGVIVNAG